MFTGIVGELGELVDVNKTNSKTTLSIKSPKIIPNTQVDNSIAVNGCCLTVVKLDKDVATFDVLNETLRCTNLGLLKVGEFVNLEDSLTLQTKLGGHLVQGHVDCTATIIDVEPEGDSKIFTFTLDKKFLNMLVPKGYICINGTSLTIMRVNSNDTFSVMVIPHTQHITIARSWKKESVVNIEIDIINKSIFHYLKCLYINNNA